MKSSDGTSNTVQSLGDMLQYQDGAVVSKVLLKNGGGSVTLFAFEKGEGLSEHTTPFEAMILVLEGDASISLAGVSHRVRDGQTIALPANVPHAIKATSRFKMMLMMLRP
jgi:quercetin dioxygenase-like cupin family protein